MSQRLVIRGGTVADGSGGPLQAAEVVVEGDRVTGIVPPGTVIDGDEIDQRIDRWFTRGFEWYNDGHEGILQARRANAETLC